jgi:hypothetical protein
MQTTYIYHWESLAMQDVGPGDADVFTKDGRHTTVNLNLTSPAVERGANRLKVHVAYDVREGRRDNTHLRMDTDILIPLPSDWSDVRVLGAADLIANVVIFGKNHQWNPINVNTVNWIQTIDAKIDGPGDDTAGNAGLRINFAIPLEFRPA